MTNRDYLLWLFDNIGYDDWEIAERIGIIIRGLRNENDEPVARFGTEAEKFFTEWLGKID